MDTTTTDMPHRARASTVIRMPRRQRRRWPLFALFVPRGRKVKRAAGDNAVDLEAFRQRRRPRLPAPDGGRLA